MAGKIGDYVHYHAQNYLNYGINKSNEGASPEINWGSRKQEILSNLKGFQDNGEIKEIKSKLNQIMGGRKSDAPDDKVVKEIWKTVEDELNKEFGETLGNITDFGDVENVTSGTVKSKASTIASKGTSIKVSTILTRIKAIEMALKDLEKSDKKSEIQNKVNDIYAELNKISKIDKIILQNRGIPEINKSLERTEEVKNLIQQVNTLTKLCATTPAINLQKGELFEYVIALMPALLHNELSKGLKDNLLKTKIGDERTQVKIDLGKFTDEIDLGSLGVKGYKIDSDTNTMVSYIASQGKIDVNLQWNDTYIPISAKNVNLNSGYGVHVLSGSSLLYLLQDESPDLVTHYMNIIADHPDGTINLPIAHEAIKSIILYKALSGDTYERDAAKLFIVNNNKTGEVEVYDIVSLVKKASKDINTYTKITSNKGSLESIRLNNNWSDGSYNERITQLIKDMHAQKISVTLNSNLLK